MTVNINWDLRRATTSSGRRNKTAASLQGLSDDKASGQVSSSSNKNTWNCASGSLGPNFKTELKGSFTRMDSELPSSGGPNAHGKRV